MICSCFFNHFHELGAHDPQFDEHTCQIGGIKNRSQSLALHFSHGVPSWVRGYVQDMGCLLLVVSTFQPFQIHHHRPKAIV